MLKIRHYIVAFLTSVCLGTTSCENKIENPNILKDFAHIETVSLQMAKSSMMSAFQDARLNRSNYLKKEGEDFYIDLSTLALKVPTVNLPNRIALVEQDFEQGRTLSTDIHNGMIEFGFSNEYVQIVDDILIITRDMDGLSYEQVVQKLDALLEEVINGDLNEYEKLSIGQVLILSKGIVEDSYQNGLATETGRLLCETNWRSVARSAIAGGLVTGAKVGWDSAVAGSIATANPIVGGVVGGLAGFTIGFVGGALITGIAHYTAGQIICDESVNSNKFLAPNTCLDQFCSQRVDGNSFLRPTAISSTIGSSTGTIYYNPNLIMR